MTTPLPLDPRKSMVDKVQSDKKRWWQTDCAYCQRWRMILLWGVIMYFVFTWFWL